MIFCVTHEYFTVKEMVKEKLICLDCKGITEFRVGKRGSGFIEALLWLTLFFPGIFYSFWRRKPEKKICQYCGGSVLLTPEMAAKLEPKTNSTLRNS
jgi:hypothetical protein